MVNEQMSSMTKSILLEAVKQYKNTIGKPYRWGKDDLEAIVAAEEWLYSQLLPEDKDALVERFEKLKRESYDLKSQIDVLGDKRYELIVETVEVRTLLEEYNGD